MVTTSLFNSVLKKYDKHHTEHASRYDLICAPVIEVIRFQTGNMQFCAT